MSERSVSVAVKAQVGDFVAGIKTARANVTAFNAELEKSAAKRQSLTQLGNTAGKVGFIAAAGLGAAVMSAASFDKAMSNVQAATHETAGNMEDLRAAAIKAGADTAFSANEAAAGIEALAKAGVTTESILSGGLSGALDLAAAGGMEVADAAEAAAGAMAQFKLEGDQVPHVADLLAAGAGKAQGEVSDMVMALKQAGTVSAQTGLSLEETTGALAAMAEQSLLGSDAGTSFKQMLAALTPNSAKAAAAMEKYNIHAFDAKGNFIGMTALAGQLTDGLGKLTAENRAMALETIFGSDAVRAASIIYDNGAAGIQQWIDKTDDAGYAAETAGIKMDNLGGDIEKLKGSLSTALIGAGEGSQAPLRSLVQDLDSAVGAFNDLPPAAQGSVTKMLAAVALLGGGVAVLSKMTVGIASTKAAMAELELTSGRTATALKSLKLAGGIAIGVFALSAAIDALEKSTDKAAPGIEGFTKSLLDFGSTASIQGLANDLGDLDKQLQAMDDPGFFSKVEGFYDKVPGGVGNLTHLVPVLGQQLSQADKEARATAQSLDTIDSALAQLVTGGHPEQAVDAIANLTKMYGLSSDEVASLTSHLPKYDEALAGASNTAKLAAGATGGLTVAQKKNEKATKAQAKALKESREAANDTAHEFVGLADSLDDGKVSLKGWIHDLEKQAEALHNFRLNAEKAAKKGLREGLIAELQAMGPVGALRMKQLANATDSEIRRANRAWKLGQTEINKYTDAVGGVPKNVSTHVAVTGAEAAAAAIHRVRLEMAGIHDKTVRLNYYVNQTNAVNKGGRDGDPKTPFYDGGYTGDYDKRAVAGVVHGREFVVNAEATAMNRPLLEALNAGRGKMMSPQLSGSAVMAGEYARLAAVVEKLEGRLARLGDDVREGAQVGSFHGTEGRFRAQGQATYMQTGS